MLGNELNELVEKAQRGAMREFFKKFTKNDDFIIFLDEFEKECQRRDIMMKKLDTYDMNPVGRTLANLMAILCELDFDMRMWNQIVEQMT